MATALFDIACQRCTRLAQFLADVKADHPDYYCRPVPSIGDPGAPLLVVGLAPGKHGANATGRPFTGDYCGDLLYSTLHQFGFCNRTQSQHVDDGLSLANCRLINAVKCLPPDNKPIGAEINNCNSYLAAELNTLTAGSAIVALGGVAHRAVIKAVGERQATHKFGHGHVHRLGELHLFDSYHCSRYNTQTRRLTPVMFEAVFDSARQHLARQGLLTHV